MPGSAYLPGRSTAAEDHLAVVLASAQELERGDAVLVATHRLAIDQAGAHSQRRDRLDDQRVTRPPIMSVAREQPHAGALAAGHHPIPVVLDFVNPLRAGWRSLDGGWKARRA
jgi:hypothetical protein